MLPIFRIISVGGVFLAIAILALALLPPGGTHVLLAERELVARGSLQSTSQHPEWRQMLIRAALRRADELERLRELRDTIVRGPAPPLSETELPESATDAPAPPQIAGIPAEARSVEPDDLTGSIPDPAATIPIEIGETSSTELPVTSAEDTPPVIRVPALQMPMSESIPLPMSRPTATTKAAAKKAETTRRTVQQRQRRKPVAPQAAAQPVPPPFNILAAIFGSLSKTDAQGPTGQASASAGPRAVAQ